MIFKRMLLLMLFLILFDRLLFFIIKTANNRLNYATEFEKSLKTYTGEKAFQMLILGTSRTYEGITPAQIKNQLGIDSLKLAFQGCGPRKCLYLYKLYRKFKQAPKYVLYGIDYFIFRIISTDMWMPSGPSENPLCFKSMLLNNKDYIDQFINNLQISFNRNSGSMDPEALIERIQQHPGGPSNMDINLDKTKMKRKYNPITPFPGKEGRYFLELLKTLKTDRVKVLLVVIPSHYGTYKYNFSRRRLLRILRRFQSRFENIWLFNFNRPAKFSLHEVNYFMDGGWGRMNSHLSKMGAAHFSKLLCEEIERKFDFSRQDFSTEYSFWGNPSEIMRIKP